jgi:indole-3-glycerol phosphate synthase
VATRRRLSESISEGEGISLLVRVGDVSDAALADAQGIEGLVLVEPVDGLAETTSLPVLARAAAPEQAHNAGADAWLLVASEHGDELAERYQATRGLGLECVVDVVDDEELQHVLESIDAEIVMLSPPFEEEEETVDRVLELLPDVPAGMLAIAELRSPTHDDVRALERAGVDAVVVGVEDLARLAEQLPFTS